MKIENDQYKGMGPLFNKPIVAVGAVDDICANKHKGNPMSVQANNIASKGKAGARQRILDILANLDRGIGWTCEDIEFRLGLSHQTCSARLSELRREGKIKIVGERKTRSGAMAAVYQIKE